MKDHKCTVCNTDLHNVQYDFEEVYCYCCDAEVESMPKDTYFDWKCATCGTTWMLPESAGNQEDCPSCEAGIHSIYIDNIFEEDELPSR